MFRFGKHSRSGSRGGEINPDEIFLDAHNLPQFDTNRFQGKLEQPLGKRAFFIFGILCTIVLAAFLSRLWVLQGFHGEVYAQQSEENRLHRSFIFAERGLFYDRNGVELAWNVPTRVSETGEAEDYSLRQYTAAPGFAHLLGYLTLPQKDKYGIYYQTTAEGVAGVERAFDERVSGVNGVKLIETDAVQNVLSESTQSLPLAGENITLSIDSRLQSKMHEYIRELAQNVPFKGGSALMMDVKTGELIVMTNFPEYDPNVLVQGEDESAISAYQSASSTPFLNRAVGGLFAPGSIVKPFMALAALEEGIISPQKQIVSTGALVIPNPWNPSQPTIFRDWRAHGATDMRRAIAVSSDVYFYQIGGGYGSQEGLGIRRIEEYMRRFGYGEPTGIALAGEKGGTIPNPEWKEENFDDGVWRIGNTYHTAIGQYGFQVTPVQVVRAFAAIANGGILRTPTLIKGATGESHELEFSQEHMRVIHEGMRQAVLGGTAAGLNVPYVHVAGKTGTAERGPGNRFVNSWAVGFFPYEKPRYAFAVLMEYGPVSNTTGGVWIMRQTLDWMRDNAPEYFEIPSE
jgi:penicillin-binding protein 2